MAIRIIIKENRSLLNEMTLEQVKGTLTSKNVRNKFINVLGRGDLGEVRINELMKVWIDCLLMSTPGNIKEKDKVLALNWLKNWSLSKTEILRAMVYEDVKGEDRIRNNLERFFQFKDFIKPQFKDLNRVSDYQMLQRIVNDARPKYEEYQKKKAYLDAEKGTEKIFEDDDWIIYIAHNKGAACELGKDAGWCTSAPGLDYFGLYYNPDDPFFIFINKKSNIPGNLYSKKYQFQYGTGQFKNANNNSIGDLTFENLHRILTSIPGIQKKYPIVANFRQEEDMVDLDDDVFYDERGEEP